MIKMYEKFYTGIKLPGVYHEIFINPTSDEMKVYEDIRGYIDFEGNLYVFHANLLHSMFLRELGKDYIDDYFSREFKLGLPLDYDKESKAFFIRNIKPKKFHIDGMIALSKQKNPSMKIIF